MKYFYQHFYQFWLNIFLVVDDSEQIVRRYDALFERAVRDGEFHSSFHVIHKVGNSGIFVLLRFVSLKKLDGGVNHFNF